jgi:hypothetical protein
MSKYDQLDYKTHSELTNNSYPQCILLSKEEEVTVPDELIGVAVTDFSKNLKLETENANKMFKFINNNQTIINEKYLQKLKRFNDKMTSKEIKELIIDYLIYYYGEKVDADYFMNNLLDIFNLRNKNYTKEQFEYFIKNEFQKDEILLTNDEDKEKFMNIISDDIQIIQENDNITNSINNSNKNSGSNIIGP